MQSFFLDLLQQLLGGVSDVPEVANVVGVTDVTKAVFIVMGRILYSSFSEFSGSQASPSLTSTCFKISPYKS